MRLKNYQITILSFAFGIFLITYFGIYFLRLNTRDEVSTDIIQSPPEYESVNVFFSNAFEDPAAIDCEKVYPVERSVTRISNNDRSALGEISYLAIAELLKGPTEYEQKQGYFTSINEGVRVKKISVENSIAVIDFDEKLNQGVAGSCRVLAIRSQITETMKQFPGVSDVIISIENRFDDILQP